LDSVLSMIGLKLILNGTRDDLPFGS